MAKNKEKIKWRLAFLAQVYAGALQDGDNETKETDGRREYFYDEDLDEECGVLGVSESGTWPDHTHRHTREDVCEADGESRAKQLVRAAVVFDECRRVVAVWHVDAVIDNDGHNDAVNGHCLTEHDAY